MNIQSLIGIIRNSRTEVERLSTEQFNELNSGAKALGIPTMHENIDNMHSAIDLLEDQGLDVSSIRREFSLLVNAIAAHGR